MYGAKQEFTALKPPINRQLAEGEGKWRLSVKKLFCCVGILSTVLSSIGIWLTVGILNTDSMSLVDSVIKIVVVVGDLFMVVGTIWLLRTTVTK